MAMALMCGAESAISLGVLTGQSLYRMNQCARSVLLSLLTTGEPPMQHMTSQAVQLTLNAANMYAQRTYGLRIAAVLKTRMARRTAMQMVVKLLNVVTNFELR